MNEPPLIQRGAQNPTDIESRTLPPNGRPLAEQPKWRRDFRIDWGEDEYVSRRDLVKFMVLTSAAFAVGQVWIVLRRLNFRHRAVKGEVPVAKVNELPVGGAKTFFYPEGSPPRLLVRVGPGSFVAYEQQCTHLQCPVVPAVAQGKLHCPCHNGWFDLRTGRPTAGPPQRALARVTLAVHDGTVYATGIEEPET